METFHVATELISSAGAEAPEVVALNIQPTAAPENTDLTLHCTCPNKHWKNAGKLE